MKWAEELIAVIEENTAREVQRQQVLYRPPILKQVYAHHHAPIDINLNSATANSKSDSVQINFITFNVHVPICM